MTRFAEIRERAETRKGDAAALSDFLPRVKSPEELRKIPDHRWLAGMTKRIFQAGFVWKVIDNKWDGFEAAFAGFDPKRLAYLSDDDLDRLVSDERIIRNGQKIATVPHNAGLLLELADEYGSAAACFADWPDEDFCGLLDMLKKRGKRLGGNTGQMFLRFMGRDSFVLSNDVYRALIAAGIVDKMPKSKRDLAAVQVAFNTWRAESGWSMTHISRTLAMSVD